MKAAAASKEDETRAVNTTPLEILDIVDILPTTKEVSQSANSLPTVPMISDTLFDLLDNSLDSGYSEARRARTGRSGNVLLIVVDSSGIFEMEVLFCACSDKKPAQEQLLKSCLFLQHSSKSKPCSLLAF